ncbi:uncharacterized protein LOC119656949 [Hermetia illucens]|uniref:uncharacterized protein LOC119656949 n=1 Tax=Hermetia illucens TaxID=343691 RepID=UPI0018CC5604|nr:uncharacterized protein LOC119656949 [Hermetia illucens]
MRTVDMFGVLAFSLYLVWCYSICFAKPSTYNFRVTRIQCENLDPRVSYNHSCSTRNLNRTLKAHNIRIAFYPNISFNDIHVQINYNLKVNNLYRRSFINMEEDFCGFTSGTSKSYLIKILWPFLKRSSNLPDTCPLIGYVNITDLVFEDTYLPPALPEGEARIDIHVRNGPKRISMIMVKFFVEIKAKGAAKLDF